MGSKFSQLFFFYLNPLLRPKPNPATARKFGEVSATLR